MKFKIRFADQIVGFFIILSLISLIFVVIVLGRTQRWFSKDITFTTVLPTAGGLSKNMAVQYRGFTIGTIKDFYLNEDDNVEVVFIIHEEYRNRVKLGSTVEMMISPVGLGNQFLFHAGRGDVLAEGSYVPQAGSAQARELIRQGLSTEPRHDDSISLLMNRASTVMDEVFRLVVNISEALGPGSDSTEMGKIIGSVQRTLADAETLPKTIDNTVTEGMKIVDDIVAELKPILSNVNALTAELTDPDGFLYSVLDTDKDVYTNLVKSLNSISEILVNLEKTSAFIPGQLPQIAGLIVELRVTLKTAEDVLVALTNNPLLRKGIPAKIDSQGDISPREIVF